jgi:hypothetical protein
MLGERRARMRIRRQPDRTKNEAAAATVVCPFLSSFLSSCCFSQLMCQLTSPCNRIRRRRFIIAGERAAALFLSASHRMLIAFALSLFLVLSLARLLSLSLSLSHRSGSPPSPSSLIRAAVMSVPLGFRYFARVSSLLNGPSLDSTSLDRSLQQQSQQLGSTRAFTPCQPAPLSAADALFAAVPFVSAVHSSLL